MSHTKEPWNDKIYIDRFWSRVDVLGQDDCWEWKRGATVQGYGCFHFGHSSIRSHRFSYQQHNGAISSHDCVCHSCDNPRCVNPSHLWLGTRAENNADKEAKQRGARPEQSGGEGNSNAILSTPEVIAAKVMARKGMPQARIAAFLGVSNATICLIVNGDRRSEESEQRVSACVNACAGIQTDDLEQCPSGGLFHLADMSNEVVKQRDELLVALETIARSLPQIACERAQMMDYANKVIASVKGGA